jgi:pimeloyl-ACP methyl ester carboxylesterase
MNNPKILLSLIMAFWLLPAAAQVADASDTDTVKPRISQPYGNNAAAGKYVKTRGFNMYYEIYGQGEPLLFIHGNGGSIAHFANQIPFFESHCRVIVADSRAQGKSADPADSLSYEMMADDLNALLDSLQLKQCHVIGWSDGGINGLLLAMRHPGKVKKLAITGANLWPDTTAVDPFAWRWAKAYNDSLAGLPKTAALKNEMKVARLLSYEPHIKTAQLKKIQCPVLVMGGDNDVILARHTLLIAESIPQSYLYIFPRSGHSTPIFYKNQFNQTVLDFFWQPYRKIEGMDKFE